MGILTEAFRLNTGYCIPKIGIGTYQLSGTSCYESVKTALETGYTHIDTASLYKNEPAICEALKGHDRTKIFLTSKIGPSQQGYDNAIAACHSSLENLQTDYLDLMLVHWPGVANVSHTDPAIVETRHNTWRALEDMFSQGKIRSLGVSNFLITHLEKLFEVCRVPPSVNQIEFHPLCHDEELRRYCTDRNIIVEAYSPLARGDRDLWGNPQLIGICEKYGKTIAQVLLRWGYQKDVVILPKSAHPDRVKTNISIEFRLEEEEMKVIDGFHVGKRTCWDPHQVKL